MIWLILGLVLLLLLLLFRDWFVTADPAKLARLAYLTGGGVLGLLAALLLVTGRFAVAVPAALGAVYLVRMGRQPGPGGAAGGRRSQVRTAILEMSLDHDTGIMTGEVRDGPFAGSNLASLTPRELDELLEYCQDTDADSARLLEAYLDRLRGTASGPGDSGSGDRHQTPTGAMSTEEAREILGVAAGASPEEIKKAHKRLMVKLHPDQGGSNYLAAKINQAKETLLKR